MRFVFSLRTLLIVLTIVTVLFGVRIYQIDHRDRTIRKVESLGGEFVLWRHRTPNRMRDLIQIQSPVLFTLDGADGQRVRAVLQELRCLPSIGEVWLTNCKLGEGDLMILSELPELFSLSLHGSSGVSENIESVAAINTLISLDISYCPGIDFVDWALFDRCLVIVGSHFPSVGEEVSQEQEEAYRRMAENFEKARRLERQEVE